MIDLKHTAIPYQLVERGELTEMPALAGPEGKFVLVMDNGQPWPLHDPWGNSPEPEHACETALIPQTWDYQSWAEQDGKSIAATMAVYSVPNYTLRVMAWPIADGAEPLAIVTATEIR
jgi:hypothetical protein